MNEADGQEDNLWAPPCFATDYMVLGESAFPLWAHISGGDNATWLSLPENSYEYHKTAYTKCMGNDKMI